ncbi:hypothetical protein [Phaeobacter sp. JH20_12]|uniref:hypothetical protein n=1 Tax=Phaeobacter sp. JH20_12 TaxID=3112471 RepID=UPI003A878F88
MTLIFAFYRGNSTSYALAESHFTDIIEAAMASPNNSKKLMLFLSYGEEQSITRIMA